VDLNFYNLRGWKIVVVLVTGSPLTLFLFEFARNKSGMARRRDVALELAYRSTARSLSSHTLLYCPTIRYSL
jgi:hypothetical protein